MSKVINKITGQVLYSVHTPNYEGDENWIINPTNEEIEQYKYTPSLDELKSAKIKQIDDRTEELCLSKFKHPDKEVYFSMSPNAQAKWLHMKEQLADSYAIFPYEVSDYDDETYEIADATELNNIYYAATARNQGYLKSNRQLIKQVKQATTIEELDAVIDDRT